MESTALWMKKIFFNWDELGRTEWDALSLNLGEKNALKRFPQGEVFFFFFAVKQYERIVAIENRTFRRPSVNWSDTRGICALLSAASLTRHGAENLKGPFRETVGQLLSWFMIGWLSYWRLVMTRPATQAARNNSANSYLSLFSRRLPILIEW